MANYGNFIHGRNIGEGAEVFKNLARGDAFNEPLTGGQPTYIFRSISSGVDINVSENDDELVFRSGQTVTGTGFGNYSDLATGQTGGLLGATLGEWTQITCDNLGVATDNRFVPPVLGSSTLWNPTTNSLDFSGLTVGDVIHTRVDVLITPEINLTDITIRLNFNNLFSLTRRLSQLNQGAGVVYSIIEDFNFYIGADIIVTGGATVEVYPTADVDIEVNGFFISVNK